MAPRLARSYPWSVSSKDETPIKFLRDRVLFNSWPIIRGAVKDLQPTDTLAYKEWLAGRALLHDSHIPALFENLLLVQQLVVAAKVTEREAADIGVAVGSHPDADAGLVVTSFDWDSLPKSPSQVAPFLLGVRADLRTLMDQRELLENWMTDALRASNVLSKSHIQVNTQLIAHRTDGLHYGVLMDSLIYNLIGFNISSGGAALKARRVAKIADDYAVLYADFVTFFEENQQQQQGEDSPPELMQEFLPVDEDVPELPLGVAAPSSDFPEELIEGLFAADVAEVLPDLSVLSDTELEAQTIAKLEAFAAIEIR